LPTVHAVGEEDPESVLAGLRATARTPGPRVMVLAVAVYYIVIGALDVLSVVIAVELLGKSAAYSGFLTTAVGVGSRGAGGAALGAAVRCPARARAGDRRPGGASRRGRRR